MVTFLDEEKSKIAQGKRAGACDLDSQRTFDSSSQRIIDEKLKAFDVDAK